MKTPNSLRTARRVSKVLSLKTHEIVKLVLIALGYTALEGFGIGLLMPVLEYVEVGKEAIQSGSSGWIWDGLLAIMAFLGLELSLIVLLAFSFTPILIRQAVYFLNIWYTAAVQNRALTRMRTEGFRALINSDMGFMLAQGTGNLVSMLTVQVNRAGQAIFQLVRLLSVVILLALYAGILLMLSPPLTAVALVAVGLIGVTSRTTIRRSRAAGQEASRRVNRSFAAISERLAAIRLIKMRGREEHESAEIERIVREQQDSLVKIAVLRGFMEIVIDPLLMLAVFVIIYVGVEFLGLTVASLGLFLFVLLRMNAKAKEFNVGRQTLSANVASLFFVRDTIDGARESRTILSGETEYTPMREGLTFDDVTFAYEQGPDGERILDHVSFEVERGTMTAIVGRSGAGKSTLADLIPRLRERDDGRILFDGVPATEFGLEGLRRSIGLMTQDAIMLNDTIRANLTYGLPEEKTDEEIWSALDSAYAREFVESLPKKLETRVGERGVRFSGGQRQRLALARTILQGPDLLILDEPTSALDSESEQYIQKALDAMRGDLTLIVIAHRLSTVQSADKIIVLEAGKVVDTGSHEELVEREGPYRRLFELQMQG